MMRKLLLILVFPFLASCVSGLIPRSNIKQTDSRVQETSIDSHCMEFRHFNVIQVLPGNFALAMVCKAKDDSFCIGPVVLLTPKVGVDYYDEMRLSIPEDRCAIQEGTYQYVSRKNNTKTVPVIAWGYKYMPKDTDEAWARFVEYLENQKNICKNGFAIKADTNKQSVLKMCDCYYDEMFKEISNQVKKGNTSIVNDNGAFYGQMRKRIEKKCGRFPD